MCFCSLLMVRDGDRVGLGDAMARVGPSGEPTLQAEANRGNMKRMER
jgi:hypothetical protein